MSTIPYPNKQKKLIFVIASLLVIGGVVFVPKMLAKPRLAPAVPVGEIRTVEAGEAGPVGDLKVSPEAMQLAEISLASITRQTVNEKLPLSGVIAPTSNGLAKVTPRVAGKVVKVLVSAGDRVSAGQTLALTESTELAQAQAAWKQARSRVAAKQANLDRQRKLAALGSFGNPSVEQAQRSSVSAQGAVDSAKSDISTAEADLTRAETELDSLKAEASQAQTRARVADSRFNRADTLYQNGLISKQEWEQVQADKESAAADVRVANAKVRQGEAGVQSAKAGVDAAKSRLKSAQRQMGIESAALQRERKVHEGGYATNREIVQAEAEVREARIELEAASQAVQLSGGSPGGGNTVAVVAPISGRIQERTVTLGEMIDTEHSVFTIVNLDQVWAELSVAPRNMGAVREGEVVELTSEALPGQTFRGRVVSIGSLADSTTRSVPVRVAIENKIGALRSGTYVKGNLITAVRRERIVVPLGAIQDHTNKKTLYVALDDKGDFEVRHVVLGATENGMVEVVEGLKGNEKIAVSGTFYLKSEALKSLLSDGCCS